MNQAQTMQMPHNTHNWKNYCLVQAMKNQTVFPGLRTQDLIPKI